MQPGLHHATYQLCLIRDTTDIMVLDWPPSDLTEDMSPEKGREITPHSPYSGNPAGEGYCVFHGMGFQTDRQSHLVK